MNHREEMYRCVACHGELSVMHHDRLMCCQCGSAYPIGDVLPLEGVVMMPINWEAEAELDPGIMATTPIAGSN